MNFAYEVFLSYLYHSLTCRKILRQGTNGFTSTLKEVMVWTFTPLKIYRPWQGLNLRTTGPDYTFESYHWLTEHQFHSPTALITAENIPRIQ
jgi:hypothetical protein